MKMLSSAAYNEANLFVRRTSGRWLPKRPVYDERRTTKHQEQERRDASTHIQSREEDFEFTADPSGANLPQREEVEWIACKMVKLISDR